MTFQNKKTILESDLNKAISCYHIISKKYEFDFQQIDQKTYSSTLLSCFTLITEEEAKDILLAIQHEENYLTIDDINRLTDVNNIKKLNRTDILQESEKLEKALNEFQNYGNNNKYKNNIINKEEEFKKVNTWKDYKLTKLMLGTTKILKYMNKIGKFIIVILCIFFFSLIIKNLGYKGNINRKNSKRK